MLKSSVVANKKGFEWSHADTVLKKDRVKQVL